MPSVRSMLSLVGAVLAAAGCNSRTQTMTAAGTLSPALSSEPAITTADVAMLTSMSRAQQLAHLTIADSMEIAMARVAVQRTQNAAIATFARRMIDDHSRSLQNGLTIARQENLTLQPAPKDTMPAHLSRTVNALSDGTPASEFDGTYMLSQIQLHQRMLDELQSLQTIVTNGSLRQYIDENVPVLDAHLASARHIAAQLGYTTVR